MHAAPNSAVGRIAAYEAAVSLTSETLDSYNALDPETTAYETLNAAYEDVVNAKQAEDVALAAAANKEVNMEVTEAVNNLLGISPVEVPEAPVEPEEPPAEEPATEEPPAET